MGDCGLGGCAPRLSPLPQPSSRVYFNSKWLNNSPRQAQPKHCPLGRGSGCSPVVQGPGGPERNSPGPLLRCLGNGAGGTAACRRVILGCKLVSPAPRPTLRRNTATWNARAAGAGQPVFPGDRLITNKAMCARHTGIPSFSQWRSRSWGGVRGAAARGHTAARPGSGWGVCWVPGLAGGQRSQTANSHSQERVLLAGSSFQSTCNQAQDWPLEKSVLARVWYNAQVMVSSFPDLTD